MKTKITLVIFLTLFGIQALAGIDKKLCEFNGILDPSKREAEFKMLLEDADRPNYIEMANMISGMVFVLGKDPTKITSTCNSALYIKQLLEFCENPINKKELADKHPEMAKFIDILKAIVVENALLAKN